MEAGRLHPMFPGTWSVGDRAVTRDGWFLAGVLSAGGDARLDGASACRHYGLYRRRIGRTFVVTDKRGGAGDRRLKIRHTDHLPPLRVHKGNPVVPVEEALLGLAASDATDKDLRRAIRQAQAMNLTTFAKLRAHADAAKGRPGVVRFRRILGDRPAPTRSELEDAAVALMRRHGLDPLCNVVVDGSRPPTTRTGTMSGPPTVGPSSDSRGMTCTSRRP